jgi:nitrogen fixation NifU-like protein
MPQYSEKVMEHFAHPRNVGEMPDADGVGTVGNPVCGDIMKMYIKVRDRVIVDARFQTFGCGAAIATSSISTEMIIGKSIDEAVQLTNAAVAEALDGLPPMKMHCSLLAEEAVKSAINDYLLRTTGVGLPGMEKKDGASCDHHLHDAAHAEE